MHDAPMHLDRDACYRALVSRDARFDGRFFVAARSSGVYCRPICPARPPKPENVLFVPSAAAAQAAGFRPCLRCRPEAAPDLGGCDGAAGTIFRALALITGGALSIDDIDALAARLGTDTVQLGRLFQRHLGASAQAVVQTRRSLFAKQLLTETGLPMADVALAAGFGSVRRCRDAIRTLYARAPRDLRRGGGGAKAAGSAITLTLPYKPPYDWLAMVGFLAPRAIPGVEHVRPDLYARTISLGGAYGSIAVRPADRRHDTPGLVATIRFPLIAALPVIVARIRRIFDLAADPDVIAARLGSDPSLAPLVAARPGLRVPGAWDGFELAVRGILGQQISVLAATRLAGKLVAAYGVPVPSADGEAVSPLRYAFPSPERLIGTDPAATLGMPRARGRAIVSLAAAALEDRLLFEPGAGLDEAIGRLCVLPGIGEWTAQYVAMRALREPDAFPAADIGLLRALATDAGRPTPAALLARAAAWRPWRAYAALHLWTAGAAAPAPVSEQGLDAAA